MKHEVTTYNTKRLIADTLKTLMLAKPFSKITVSELINTCKIFTDLKYLLLFVIKLQIIFTGSNLSCD